MFIIHGEGEVEEDIRSGRAISKYIVDQVKIVILTTGMAISPAHFVVVVVVVGVRLNPQEGMTWVVGFVIKGRGGLHQIAGQGRQVSTR